MGKRFADFEASIDQRLADFRTSVDRRFTDFEASIRAELDGRFTELHRCLDTRFRVIEERLDCLEKHPVARQPAAAGPALPRQVRPATRSHGTQNSTIRPV
jgi:hypothetical protein